MVITRSSLRTPPPSTRLVVSPRVQPSKAVKVVVRASPPRKETAAAKTRSKPKCPGDIAAAATNVPDHAYHQVQSGLRKAKLSIRLPALRDAKGRFTVGGLMVAFFGKHLGRVVSKEDLVEYLRRNGSTSVDPQPRHLGMQVGLNFLVQGCRHPRTGRVLRQGEYCLLDVKKAHPNHHTMHRAAPPSNGRCLLDFEAIKAIYDHRCACCGSREGQPHLKNQHLLTRLDRGHCDPRMPLSDTNCIPMCTTCNMVYKDRAVINKRGFISSWLGIDTHADELSTSVAEDAEDAESFITCACGDPDDDDQEEEGEKMSWWTMQRPVLMWCLKFINKFMWYHDP